MCATFVTILLFFSSQNLSVEDPENEVNPESPEDDLLEDVYFSSTESVNEVGINNTSTAVTKSVGEMVQSLLHWSTQYGVSDNGMSSLFKLLKSSLEFTEQDTQPLPVSKQIPLTIRAAMSIITSSEPVQTLELLTCRKCMSVYSDWRQMNAATNSKCIHISTPYHSHATRRNACDNPLFIQEAGARIPRPILVYPYIPLSQSLHSFLQRPGFITLCQEYVHQVEPTDESSRLSTSLLCDIYDGKMWKKFSTMEGQPFLSMQSSQSLHLAFQLNVDGFRAFTHTNYSVGGIYLTILNLPRHMRYRLENTVLVGIVPGPKEPPLHMNSFLGPLIADLLALMNGVRMSAIDSNDVCSQITVRAALISVVCDIPALKRLAGFVGIAANKGCSKCLKPFPTASFGESPDYSGFDRENWPKRSNTEHRLLVPEYLSKTNRAQQKEFESQHGFRYSQLLQLPYFDIIRCCTVDPMHNLFLGTAKYFIVQLIDKGILAKDHLQIIEQRVSAMNAPINIGRLPSKIASGFSGFKADQWRNWTIVFSLVALKGLIPASYLACWSKFVKACRLLCCRSISHDALAMADNFLQTYCVSFQNLFGNNACTINMHKHLHLKECVEDFGPVYSFWCYPFERFNGQLGAYHTNNRSIERQVVQKFLREQCLASAHSYGDVDNTPAISRHTLQHIQWLQKVPLPVEPCQFACEDAGPASDSAAHTIRNKEILSIERQDALKQAYSSMYEEVSFEQLALEVECLKTILHCGMEIKVSSVIAVKWPPNDPSQHICKVKSVLKHLAIISNTSISHSELLQVSESGQRFIEHTFVEVQFFCRHPQENYYEEFDDHILVTWPELDNTMGRWMMVPLQRILGICASGNLVLDLPVHTSGTSHSQTLKVSNILPVNVAVR